MVTDGVWLADWMMLDTMMLTTSRTKITSQKRRHRMGLYPTTFCPLGLAGAGFFG